MAILIVFIPLFAGVCSSFKKSNLFRDIYFKIEFPFAPMAGIAVDSEGKIYCGSIIFERVQVYNKDGRFLHGWFTRLSHTSFNIGIDEQNNIRIAKPMTDHYYDSKGKLLSIIEHEYSDLGEYYDMIEQCPNGEVYRIEGTFLPRIIKVDSKQKDVAIVSDIIRLWVVRLFLPALIFILVAFVVDFLFFSKKENTPYNSRI